MQKITHHLTLWSAMAVLLAGCATSTLPPLPPPVLPLPLHSTPDQPPKDVASTYTIGPEDVLKIQVYEHQDLSQTVTVTPEGSFAYPLLGRIQTVGLSVQQLEERMVQRLAEGYVLDPQLSISVEAYRNRHVYVLGAVHKPGVYPLRHQATLVELLAQAGGLVRSIPDSTRRDAAWYVQVVRAVAERNGARPGTTPNLYSPTAVVVDLEKLFAGQVTPPIRLESGDTIYVPEKPSFYIEGEVAKPGQYALEQGITVHQAVTQAGGFSKFARRTHLWVKRVVDGQPRAFRARLDDYLQAGDVLVVPESIF